MARITVVINGVQQSFALNEGTLMIGRQLDNGIVLNNAVVSRHHARIELQGRQASIHDLNSRNGIFVNRLRTRFERLKDNDVIGIGPYELLFEDRAAQKVVFDDNQYFPLAAEAQPIVPDNPSVIQSDSLHRIYGVSMRLNQTVDFYELLDLAMAEVLGIIPAQRGLLMLFKGKELVPMVMVPPSNEDVAFSSTIVRKAMEGGEAVLTSDARVDFEGSQSVINANIRSAICVPLISSSGPIGLLLLDSPGKAHFSEHDRDVVAALSGQIAAAIERARLTDRVRQEEQVRQNLERFLSPNVAQAVANHVTQHGKLWEAQEQMVTVLFTDVQGFTALSERMSPRDVQDLLNEYLHEMTEVIFNYGGTVDKYIGDGIMAIFGAPRLPDEPETDRHAFDAVATALDMLVAQRKLVDKLEPEKAFNIRIGINTGIAYTGFFGTRHRLEYTAIGDAVNTASRLESAADPGSVFVGEQTRLMVGNAFTFQEVGELQLKGKEKRVRAYKVLGKTS